MWLLDVEAILDRENDIRGFDAEIEVLKRHNDKSTSYAILSHRWGTEVTYDEITGLTAMKPRKRDSVRERDGYQKIIKSCEQAKQDGYKWMWIDTCCIDKRSSAELSEAINSMYRWYRNAQKCYVYLNDVVESIFPTEQDFSKFGGSSGWPEWFSRGWTLQELIAPTEVEFFNNSWVSIGTKRDLTSSLEVITRIPEMVLKYEQVLRSTSTRPGVAHIMSWAAHRKTTRVEDRAYSLMGLFGVNMPMLYGEGSKAFQRLQLEIIRVSSDHSIFAWNSKGQFREHGSVLADDPSCFRGCTDVEKVSPSGFTKELEQYMCRNGLFLSKDASKLGSSRSNVDFLQLARWDVTNVGIQVWLPIIPHRGSNHFKTILPCRDRYGNLITIDLEFRGLNFVRSLRAVAIRNTWPQFRSLYLDCSQDAEESHDLCLYDGQASYGFTRCGTFPFEVAGDTVTLSSQGNNLVILLYANDDTRSRFAVGLGYHLGRVWARIVCDEYPAKQEVWSPWEDFAQQAYDILWDAPIEKSWQHCYSHSTSVTIEDTHLPRSIWHARVVYDDCDSGYTNVMVDIQQCSGCCAAPRECTYRSRRDKLWLPWTSQTVASHELELDGRSAWLDECSGQDITLGDYGDYRPNGRLKRHGNIFEDMKELGINPADSVYRPVVSCVSGCGDMPHRIQTQHEIVTTSGFWIPLELHQPKGLSLPSNKEFELLLKNFSTRLSGKCLVKTVIECSQVHLVDREGRREALGGDGNRSAAPGMLTPLCIIATPLAWNNGPASTQRRERFQNIRERFYASANLHHLAGTEAPRKSTIDGVVDFSAMFGLEYLENYVGEITFFERLSSIMESQPLSVGSAGNGLSAQPNPSFNSHRQLLIPLLLAKYEGRSKPWLDGKRKAQHEVELLSQTLGIGLLQHIRNTFLDASEGKQRASQVGHTDYDMENVCSTVQALQTRLQATEDEDEQRALEEDITGKILQFYLCGIYAEVDQLLPKVVDHIRNGLGSKMIPKDRIRSDLREIADMIKGTRRTDMNHETAHLWRIMLDSGAGVSKHKLWLSARDAEQARRLRFSGGGSILSTQDNASSTSAAVSSTSTVQQVVAPGDGGR